MKAELEPGSYVLAVSGGVDSVVLLDVLCKLKNIKLVVAHYDHGIRPDSKKDREFVSELAKKYVLPFYFEEGKLGSETSEAGARAKRYEFLRKIVKKTNSKTIVTAHHQDDVIETALINLLRGTGRKGLSSLKSTEEIKRPLLGISKIEIKNYAKSNNLAWREDPTNIDQNYLRNYVRHSLVPKMTKQQKEQLINLLDSTKSNNKMLDQIFYELVRGNVKNDITKRSFMVSLPASVAKEFLAEWLRTKNIEFDSKTIDRLLVFIKAGRDKAKANATKGWVLKIEGGNIRLSNTQSV